MNHGQRGRCGATILIGTVVLVLLVVAVIGIARQMHASRVAAGAQGAAVGALAQDAAQSAIEEALVAVGQQANTGGTPLFEALRAARPGPVADLRIAAPLIAEALARDPLTAELELEGKGVTVAVRGIAPLADTALDRAVTLELTATVKHRSTGILRRVRRQQSARVALLTVPRPFDQFTYLALDASALIDPGTTAELTRTSGWMRDVRDRIAPEVRSRARDVLEKINRALEKQEYDVEALTAPFAPDRHPAPRVFSESVRDEHHLMPVALTLFSRDATLADLSAVHQVPGWKKRTARVESTRTAYAAARRVYDGALDRLERVSRDRAWAEVIPSFDAWKKALEDLGRALASLSEAHAELLAEHHAYTRRWGELAGEARDQLVALAPALTVAAFARRAEHRFGGPQALEALATFLARYASSGINASIHVETDRPLELARLLKGPFRGRLILSTPGPVVLRDISLSNVASDMLVICAGGEVSVAGTVHAALIAGAGFVAAPDATLAGLLIQPAVVKPEGLRGRVDNEGRYHTAAAGKPHPGFAQVSLAPTATKVTIERE